MPEHTGLPVSGYKPQSDDKVALVNAAKVLEEHCLRQVESLQAQGVHDARMLALGKTGIQDAFMWINRAVFQPGRVSLPGDAQG